MVIYFPLLSLYLSIYTSNYDKNTSRWGNTKCRNDHSTVNLRSLATDWSTRRLFRTWSNISQRLYFHINTALSYIYLFARTNSWFYIWTYNRHAHTSSHATKWFWFYLDYTDVQSHVVQFHILHSISICQRRLHFWVPRSAITSCTIKQFNVTTPQYETSFPCISTCTLWNCLGTVPK